MYLTQNTLFPYKSTAGGLASTFIQREAICGKAGSGGLDAVIHALTTSAGPWADGASVNIVDLKAKRMANVEVHQGQHAVTEVTEAMFNYSHFNMYKALQPGVVDPLDTSTAHRQARVWALPAPHEKADIMRILSDRHDEAYPVFRDETLATLVLDGATGHLNAWCCGQSPASGAAPVRSWNLLPSELVEQSRVALFT
mmetsp:Transcript_8929/g.23003  ORF Transcript_8929/g.23003 Transcript_8929/m.23003 type:complete len:198 (+) Transcript_8929:646-1239(+)